MNDKVIFAGRLADYKYYNMDQAVARALGVFEKQVAGGKTLLRTRALNLEKGIR